MRNICYLYLISLLLITKVASAANMHLQIKGLRSLALERNVYAQISTIQNSQTMLGDQYQVYLDKAIRNGLKALGYYESKIDFELRPLPLIGSKILIANITLGEPVRIAGVNVILCGDAQIDRDYVDLLNKLPKVGSVLNHGDYDSFKKSIANIALRKGYFDGHFNKSKLYVAIDHHQAFWDINYNSGQRYRFGVVTFAGSQIRDEYLRNLIPFKEGDYYHASNLGEFHRRLSATGWFNSVLVAPEFNQVYKNKLLPLHGMVLPHTGNIVEIGLGYSTDIGSRMKAVWKRPWINSYGHSLLINSSISALEQELDFSYKIPLLKHPLEQYYLVQGGFKRLHLINVGSNVITTFAVSRYWDLSNDWQLAINLRWNFDHVAHVNISNSTTTTMLYPGVTITRTHAYGGLMPICGDTQRYSIEYSNTLWGSHIDFLVIQAQNIWIHTFYKYHRFLIRGNLGWIFTSDFAKVPQDKRFFAGGDRSIRGYRYKSIAIKNYDDKLIGAEKMLTGSLEYQYNVIGKWWGAMFIDGGEAVNKIDYNNFKVGAGIGVRWQSLVGSIKFDFAIPISGEEHGLRFYISLGPEL